MRSTASPTSPRSCCARRWPAAHDDKRVRQNLALVLGLQGKFDEARKVASLDMSDQDAKSNMTYLRNMLSNPTQFAAASPGGADGSAAGDDWAALRLPPSGKGAAPSKSAAATEVAAPKVQVVKAAEEIEAPSAAKRASPLACQTQQGGRNADADHAGQRHAHTSPSRHTYRSCRSGWPCRVSSELIPTDSEVRKPDVERCRREQRFLLHASA